jgi:hypothetical protein
MRLLCACAAQSSASGITGPRIRTRQPPGVDLAGDGLALPVEARPVCTLTVFRNSVVNGKQVCCQIKHNIDPG